MGAVVVWVELVRELLVVFVGMCELVRRVLCVVRISRGLCIALVLCLCMLCVPSVLWCGCSVWMFGILFFVLAA